MSNSVFLTIPATKINLDFSSSQYAELMRRVNAANQATAEYIATKVEDALRNYFQDELAAALAARREITPAPRRSSRTKYDVAIASPDCS